MRGYWRLRDPNLEFEAYDQRVGLGSTTQILVAFSAAYNALHEKKASGTDGEGPTQRGASSSSGAVNTLLLTMCWAHSALPVVLFHIVEAALVTRLGGVQDADALRIYFLLSLVRVGALCLLRSEDRGECRGEEEVARGLEWVEGLSWL